MGAGSKISLFLHACQTRTFILKDTISAGFKVPNERKYVVVFHFLVKTKNKQTIKNVSFPAFLFFVQNLITKRFPAFLLFFCAKWKNENISCLLFLLVFFILRKRTDEKYLDLLHKHGTVFFYGSFVMDFYCSGLCNKTHWPQLYCCCKSLNIIA